MVDARLADGSRINVIVPPLSLDGSILTIRKFAKDAFRVHDLIAMGTITEQVASVLAATVEGGMNILISGGTGTGKTTMLNVRSSVGEVSTVTEVPNVSTPMAMFTGMDVDQLVGGRFGCVHGETHAPNVFTASMISTLAGGAWALASPG